MNLGIFFVLSLIALTDLCDTVSQISLKSSINSLDLHLDTIAKIIKFVLKLIQEPRVWVSFIFSTISLAIWIFVLSKCELNFAYSLDSMRYIMITFASVFFLREKVGFARWLGIFFVVSGIALVASG